MRHPDGERTDLIITVDHANADGTACLYAGIVDEIRAAIAFVARRTGGPVTVFGRSAGGHLSACMLATDWRAYDLSLDADTVRAAMPISGLFDLEPLLATSLNRGLRLDAAEARRRSPLFWETPPGRSVIAYVGGPLSTHRPTPKYPSTDP